MGLNFFEGISLDAYKSNIENRSQKSLSVFEI